MEGSRVTLKGKEDAGELLEVVWEAGESFESADGAEGASAMMRAVEETLRGLRGAGAIVGVLCNMNRVARDTYRG